MTQNKQLKVIPHNRPTIGQEEIEEVVGCLLNNELTIGTKVKQFENTFQSFIGIDSVAVSSGTSAIHLALIALDIKENDEVIIPTYTCSAVGFPILYQCATPILTDVNRDYNISINEIEKNISTRTKAVIVPHMFGCPAGINEIKEICVDNNIFLLEDCAQSIGAKINNKMMGTYGDISIFSFYATKMITSIQGGMICSNNPEYMDLIRDLRYHDQVCSNNDKRIKYSYMMSDINAAIGNKQLSKLKRFINRRREISTIYKDNIQGVEHPIEEHNKFHVFSRYVIKTLYKEKLIMELNRNGISTASMHDPPLHKRALFNLNPSRNYPETEKIIQTAVSLPIYPSLTDDEAIFISDTINKILINYV